MLVAGEGRDPTPQHLMSIAATVGLKRADTIVDEVRTAIRRFPVFADQAGVPSKLRRTIAAALGLVKR
jgi:serine/threonine-protein kinase HipA